MCGLAGFVGSGTRQDLTGMTAALRHRGPDDQGFYCEEGVGFGFDRLSIIDLSSAGHQPMWNRARSLVLMLNGEVYNYRELRSQCQKEGFLFQSASDTEVIIALYEKHGEDCFALLNGMFAIALFDIEKKKLILARDRMGKKPLYFGMFENSFLFGSELKALLAHPLARKEIDMAALNMYFALDYVPTPYSIFKGIQKLEPGRFLVYEDGASRIQKFWEPDFHEQPFSFSEALTALDEKIAKSVSSRLIADVPIGVFLSGGIDSSTIAYYAAREKQKNGEKINTFSIGFAEKSFDESHYAREVAAHLGTIHHHHQLSAEDSLALLPELFAHLDEPLADASFTPTYLLSRFAKEQVTVALGGDGGDELFGGYSTFQAEQFAPLFGLFPDAVRGLFEPLISFLPTAYTNFNIKFELQKFLEGFPPGRKNEKDSLFRRHMRWLGTFDDEARSHLFAKERWKELAHADPYKSGTVAFRESTAENPLNALLWAYQRTYMMDQVMTKVDRATMFASLEARAPFLDYELVEFVNRLPYRYKVQGFSVKYILKKLMAGKLPHHIVHRKKKGFGLPIGLWLRGPLKKWGEELISDLETSSGDIINAQYVRQLWKEHQAGKHYHRKKLWNILTFLEWRKHFL